MTLETKAAFATRLGFDRSIFSRKKDGIKTLPDWLVLNGDLVEVEESIRRREAMASSLPHHRAHALQLETERQSRTDDQTRTEEKETSDTGTSHLKKNADKQNEIETLNLRLKRSEANIREHDEEIKRMERELKAGSLLPREAVEYALDDYGAELRGLLENLADRMAPIIHPLQTLEEVHAALTDMAQEVLQSMHDKLQQRAHEKRAP